MSTHLTGAGSCRARLAAGAAGLSPVARHRLRPGSAVACRRWLRDASLAARRPYYSYCPPRHERASLATDGSGVCS
jgi:hypothetical protein